MLPYVLWQVLPVAQLLLAVAHDEVAVALDGHVGLLARRLQRALRLDGVDTTDQHAQTDAHAAV